MPSVTLLQATTLGRQSLAAGCSVDVSEDVAQAWVDAGIARFDREAATQPNPAQSALNTDDCATETVAEQANSGKTASKPRAPKRGA